MKKLLLILLVPILAAAMLTGCAKKAAKDVSDTVSSAVSDVKENAEHYATDGKIQTDATDTKPTMTDMDEMIDNGVIDDENNDPTDGDNIDDDENADGADNNNDSEADGGEHNDETTDDGNSEFI